jgi:hypothetical protein
MEALTAVSVAALTVYDMVKAVEKSMRIEGVRLILKDGGKSGRYEAEAMISVEEALGPRQPWPLPPRCRLKPCLLPMGRLLAAWMCAPARVRRSATSPLSMPRRWTAMPCRATRRRATVLAVIGEAGAGHGFEGPGRPRPGRAHLHRRTRCPKARARVIQEDVTRDGDRITLTARRRTDRPISARAARISAPATALPPAACAQ